MSEPIAKPPRKNPRLRTVQPTLPPAARSRTALAFTVAAAEGRFCLQKCEACGMLTHPPREVCPHCLSLDVGVTVLAHVHGDVVPGGRVRMIARTDKSGQGVMMALPDKEVEHMADDKQLRELTCDPKHRRVLITDGRTGAGQALALAMSAAGRRLARVCRATGARSDRQCRDCSAGYHRYQFGTGMRRRVWRQGRYRDQQRALYPPRRHHGAARCGDVAR